MAESEPLSTHPLTHPLASIDREAFIEGPFKQSYPVPCASTQKHTCSITHHPLEAAEEALECHHHQTLRQVRQVARLQPGLPLHAGHWAQLSAGVQIRRASSRDLPKGVDTAETCCVQACPQTQPLTILPQWTHWLCIICRAAWAIVGCLEGEK